MAKKIVRKPLKAKEVEEEVEVEETEVEETEVDETEVDETEEEAEEAEEAVVVKKVVGKKVVAKPATKVAAKKVVAKPATKVAAKPATKVAAKPTKVVAKKDVLAIKKSATVFTGKDKILHDLRDATEAAWNEGKEPAAQASISLKLVETVYNLIPSHIIAALAEGNNVKFGEIYFRSKVKAAAIHGSAISTFVTAIANHQYATMKELKLGEVIKAYGNYNDDDEFVTFNAKELKEINKDMTAKENEENFEIIAEQINS